MEVCRRLLVGPPVLLHLQNPGNAPAVLAHFSPDWYFGGTTNSDFVILLQNFC